MPAKRTESQYALERQVLDGALRSRGADVEFPTHGKAVAFRQRCYAFRKWKRESLGEASPYEILTIKDLGKDGRVVQIRPRELEATVTFLDGPPLNQDHFEENFTIDDDELLGEADNLVKRLGIDL